MRHDASSVKALVTGVNGTLTNVVNATLTPVALGFDSRSTSRAGRGRSGDDENRGEADAARQAAGGPDRLPGGDDRQAEPQPRRPGLRRARQARGAAGAPRERRATPVAARPRHRRGEGARRPPVPTGDRRRDHHRRGHAERAAGDHVQPAHHPPHGRARRQTAQEAGVGAVPGAFRGGLGRARRRSRPHARGPRLRSARRQPAALPARPEAVRVRGRHLRDADRTRRPPHPPRHGAGGGARHRQGAGAGRDLPPDALGRRHPARLPGDRTHLRPARLRALRALHGEDREPPVRPDLPPAALALLRADVRRPRAALDHLAAEGHERVPFGYPKFDRLVRAIDEPDAWPIPGRGRASASSGRRTRASATAGSASAPSRRAGGRRSRPRRPIRTSRSSSSRTRRCSTSAARPS